MAEKESKIVTFTGEFIRKTKILYEPLAGCVFSDEECEEIATNMISLELYLRELKEKYEKASISFD